MKHRAEILNWEGFKHMGIGISSKISGWVAVLCCCVMLLVPMRGRAQEGLDSLYCRLQGRLEIGAELSDGKQGISARDTLFNALQDFPSPLNAGFKRLLGEFRYYIGYSAFYNSYANFSEYDNQVGIESLEIADSLISELDGPGSDLRARILRLRGMFAYFMEKNVFEAEDYYEASYREWLGVAQKDSVEIAVVLQCMGQAASKLGEYEKAIDLYRQSLEIRERVFGKMHARVGFANLNIGNSYAYSDRYEEALKAYQTALEIYQITAADDHATISNILMNLATTYIELEQYEGAITNLQTAISLRKRFDSPHSLDLIRYYSVLAIAYAYQNEFKKAKAVLRELDAVCGYHQLKDGVNIAQFRLYEAKVLILEDAPVSSILEALQVSMAAIASGADSDDWRSYPNIHSTSEPLLLQQIILDKSSFLGKSGRNSKDGIEYLEASLRGFETAAKLSDLLRDEYDDQDDKLFLSGRGSHYLQDALHCAYELWQASGQVQYIDRAFKLMETCKFQLLLEFLRKSRVQASSEVGTIALARLDALRRRSTELDYLLALPGLPLDSQKHYHQELLDLRIQLQGLQDSLESNSRIFRTVYGDKISLSTDSLQNLIPENSLALSFSIADSAAFIIQVSRSGVGFRKAVLPPQFQDSVSRWVDLCRKPLEEKKEIQEFARIGYLLYSLLVKPELENAQDMNHLLLIPDGILGSLPFEALVTEPPREGLKGFAQMPYLLRKFSCHYAASATLWCDQQNVRFGSEGMECLGIAWGQNAVDTLPGIRGKIRGLKGTEKELEMLQEIVQGKFLVGSESTEKQFKASASQYGILHLALHARATESDPQILFPSGGSMGEDGILHFHELFPLHLHSRLAVLSACETGAGKLLQGEGIQSMSSGFAAAGIPSLIMSLWEVDDKTGGEIMEAFYRNLESGKMIDESLQLAKLAYLDQVSGDKAAPYYWSAFVPMGNMAPLHIKAPESNSWWMVLAGGVFCLCIFITIRIYVKNRKSI